MPQPISFETFSGSAAENNERWFVPAIGAPLAADVVDLAALRAGERVLDVACGTDVVARHVVERVGAAGTVVGIDINPGMHRHLTDRLHGGGCRHSHSGGCSDRLVRGERRQAPPSRWQMPPLSWTKKDVPLWSARSSPGGSRSPRTAAWSCRSLSPLPPRVGDAQSWRRI
jgi:ubiE/COQ5 methyltransferase family